MKLCIFDLDGTLIDSLYDLASSVNYGLEKVGLPTHTNEAYKQFIGNGADILISKALGDKQVYHQEVKQYFFEYYLENCFKQTIVYDGIYEMLEELKKQGYLLAVATNKPHPLAVKIVAHLFPNTFTYVYGASDDYPKKPNSYMVDTIRKQLQIPHGQTVYLGDSDVDMYTGFNSCVYAVGVTWGFRTREELLHAGGRQVIDHPLELLRILPTLEVPSIGVSACLAGHKCRYDGKDNYLEEIQEGLIKNRYLCICPEVFGGLPTPRISCEIQGDKVVNQEGLDCTQEFHQGAKKCYDILSENTITKVYLKGKSPSCGKGIVYDGTFTRNLIKGNGITTQYLLERGIMIDEKN